MFAITESKSDVHIASASQYRPLYIVDKGGKPFSWCRIGIIPTLAALASTHVVTGYALLQCALWNVCLYTHPIVILHFSRVLVYSVMYIAPASSPR